MQLSVDIVDHIFSFLIWHHETLVACSKDPVLSHIVERYLYYRVVVHLDIKRHHVVAFQQEHLSKLISQNPRILNYVRILQIHCPALLRNDDPQDWMDASDDFATTLLMFPALQSILLTSSENVWHWSAHFQAALEDRLNLSTLEEIHLMGGDNFPFSLLEKCKHIKNLSLSGRFNQEGISFDLDSTLPHLKSLNLCTCYISLSFLTWLTIHINELQSLRCPLSSRHLLSNLLGACLGTLKILELDFVDSPYYSASSHSFYNRLFRNDALWGLPPFPPNLQQITILTAADLYYEELEVEDIWSWLPAAVKTINLLGSLQHLVFDIDIRPKTLHSFNISHIDLIDFSPLAVLSPASRFISRIDLNVHVGKTHGSNILDQFMASLQSRNDPLGSIKEGVLFFHSESTPPGGIGPPFVFNEGILDA